MIATCNIKITVGHRLKKKTTKKNLDWFFKDSIFAEIGPNQSASILWTNTGPFLTKMVPLERRDRDGSIGAICIVHGCDPNWSCFNAPVESLSHIDDTIIWP